MLGDPKGFKKIEPENGWGTYSGAMDWLLSVIFACEDNPGATIRISK
jgi:hypothetical protein